MRTLVIGDIHGNVEALNDSLKKANFNIEEDRIICVGDYIDGWGNSFEVVRILLFFDELKYFHKEQNKLYIHAGFDLEIGFEKTLKDKKDELLLSRSLHYEALNLWHINNNLKLNRKGMWPVLFRFWI